jgi:hypothetical protein
MQGVLEKGEEAVAHDEETVILLQEVVTISGSHLNLISVHAGRSGKGVGVTPVFAVFGDFEIGECLWLRDENDTDAPAIGVERELAFDGALQSAVHVDHEHAAQFGVEDALDSETVILQDLF